MSAISLVLTLAPPLQWFADGRNATSKHSRQRPLERHVPTLSALQATQERHQILLLFSLSFTPNIRSKNSTVSSDVIRLSVSQGGVCAS